MIDRQLIDAYVSRRDPSAFRELVARHGEAVLRACRRQLHDPHEAEDAFQATFLVLIRRAPSIRDPELLDRWLVGVARRVASRARRRGARQAERERRWAEGRPTTKTPDGGDWPLFEVRQVVREELGKLPDCYREPLSLCYLDGLTHEEAARKLGCPVGTVKVRLVRARGLLRDRLDRRGVALGVVLLLLWLRREVLAGSIEALAGPTAEAMGLARAGQVALLASRFPRAVALARVGSRAVGALRPGPNLALALILIAAVATSLVLARRVEAAREASADASARLARVLQVDCR